MYSQFMMHGQKNIKSSGLSRHCIHSSSVVRMEHPDHTTRQPTELAWQIPIACIQCWDILDDVQWNFPKYV